MFSRALVICAENSVEIKHPIRKHMNKKHRKLPHFSREFKEAHAAHKQAFTEWRTAGRPSDKFHPAKEKVLQSRRQLQQITRNENAINSIDFANDLIETHRNDISKVCSKLKKFHVCCIFV